MTAQIAIENFYFAYKATPPGQVVLRNINLKVDKGSFTCLIGPSGAGKTTLCRAITGIVPFYMGGRYAGDVKVLGKSTKGQRVSDIAMHVGFIMEDYESQLVSLTAGEEAAKIAFGFYFGGGAGAHRFRRAGLGHGSRRRPKFIQFIGFHP